MTQNHWRNGENLTQKETDMAEHLKVAPHMANSTILKKNYVASPVRKGEREENLLFMSLTASCWLGTRMHVHQVFLLMENTVHEKVKKTATRRQIDNYAMSNGWSVTAWYTKSLLEKVPPLTVKQKTCAGGSLPMFVEGNEP
jgi:hypothetical protein